MSENKELNSYLLKKNWQIHSVTVVFNGIFNSKNFVNSHNS